jgi:hypothetical protein
MVKKKTQQCVIVVAVHTEQREPVRAFYKLHRSYQPTSLIMKTATMRQSLLDIALAEFESFRRKYESLRELASLFEVADKVKKLKERERSNP